MVDVGGGSSALAVDLVVAGMEPILVVDVSEAALERSRTKAAATGGISWRVADVTTVTQLGSFDVWHDRAVFHFLTGESDRQHYADLARRTVPIGGKLVMATFGPEGPESCSGLPVLRYDAASIAAELSGFDPVDSWIAVHRTPGGVAQQFLWSVFERR